MNSQNKITKLNRFTTLPILLDFLERRKLVLLDPVTWEDKNDVEIILEYKKKMNVKKLFALCFSHDTETIHHWKTFSNGSSGCCIEFDANKIFTILDKLDNIRHDIVKYKRLKEVEKTPVPRSEMPFTKRYPYRCEQEYRIIWEGNTKDNVYEIDVPLNTINKITISQQMPDQIYNTIKNYLKGNFKKPDSKMNRSTVYENKRWISSFKD